MGKNPTLDLTFLVFTKDNFLFGGIATFNFLKHSRAFNISNGRQN